MGSDGVAGRSADGRTVVLRCRGWRRTGRLVQPVYGYVAVAAGRDADPDAGEPLGRTGDPDLGAALARVLGADGAAAVLTAEADALLGAGRRRR